MEKNNQLKWRGPFLTSRESSRQSEFDKYYLDVSEKEVFKASGEVDPDTGEALGVVEQKLIVKKIDIHEYLQAQADSVGVAAYMKALLLQGDSIDNYNTIVKDDIVDVSEMPDTLAEVMTAGDKAKAAFANLDPALKGDHTTIEGFLNSLTKEVVENYIKGRVEALTPKSEKKGEIE